MYQSGDVSNGYSAALNPVSAQPGNQGGQAPDAQSKPTAGGSRQSNSAAQTAAGQSNAKSPTQSASPSLGYSSSTSSYYNSSELKVDSTYDRLASGGLAGLAGNASAIAQFVQNVLANQTDAQKQALKTDLNNQFTRFIDGLFANPSSGQAGSQTVPGFQSPQDLASQSCSDLGELHGQLITDVFFMETTVNTIFEYYQTVRDVIVGKC